MNSSGASEFEIYEHQLFTASDLLRLNDFAKSENIQVEESQSVQHSRKVDVFDVSTLRRTGGVVVSRQLWPTSASSERNLLACRL